MSSGQIVGNGVLASEIRTVPQFEKIFASAGFEVIVTEGSAQSVKVLGDQNLLQYFDTEVTEKTLLINIKNTNQLGITTQLQHKVEITIPFVERIEMQASAKCKVNGFNGIRKLSISAENSSKVELESGFNSLNKVVMESSRSAVISTCKIMVDTVEISAFVNTTIRTRARHVLGEVKTGGLIEIFGNPQSNLLKAQAGGVISVGILNGCDLATFTEKVENESTKSELYPNPCFKKTNVNIKLNKLTNVTLRITNSQSELVYHQHLKLPAGIQKVHMDLSDCPNGIYNCTVLANGKIMGNHKLCLNSF